MRECVGDGGSWGGMDRGGWEVMKGCRKLWRRSREGERGRK